MNPKSPDDAEPLPPVPAQAGDGKHRPSPRWTKSKRANERLADQATNTVGTFWIAQILHVGVMFTDEAEFNDGLAEFVEQLDDSILNSLADRIDVRRLLRLLGGEGEMTDNDLLGEFTYELQRQKCFGFLCLVHAPEVTRHGKSADVRYGFQQRRWFYDEDLAGILEQAGQWAKSLEKTDVPSDTPAVAPSDHQKPAGSDSQEKS